MPRIETTVIEGPHEPTGISDTPTRERLFVCQPASPAEEPACAEKIVSTLEHRAFRRPITSQDTAPALAFYKKAREDGGDFDAGIRAAVARTLVSPWFLFRVESDSADVPAGSNHAISDLELASRLSFFLWSSIPDDELLGLAEQGQAAKTRACSRRKWIDVGGSALRRARRQLRRSMAAPAQPRDARTARPAAVPGLRRQPANGVPPRDGAAVRERAARGSARARAPDRQLHVRERAAGSSLRDPQACTARVSARSSSRTRIALGCSATAASCRSRRLSTRTSPIIRGKFIVTEFWNNPPPAPPANVPALEESKPQGRPSTVREQLELHRANPTVRGLPQQHRPCRVRTGELRRGRLVARQDSRGAQDRLGGRPRGRHAGGRAGRAP